MSVPTTVGQLLVNQALPADLRRSDRVLSGDELTNLLSEVGRRDPDLYREVSKKLMDLGREHAFLNGTTLSIEDLRRGKRLRQEVMPTLRAGEAAIRRNKALSETERRAALGALYDDVHQALVKHTMDTAVAENNPFGLQVLSKARGNPIQLASVLSTPGAFRDAKGKSLGLFVDRSYGEGLRPHEYYAAAFGARQSVISTKFATRDAGDLGKQMTNAAMRLRVVEEDCGTSNGLPVPVDDADNQGALLARPAYGYVRNAPIDTKFIKANKDGKQREILVRSPITCASQNGVCKMCTGLRETGKLPEIGQAIGIQATSSLGERIAQGALNVKHSGGQKGKQQTYAGFPVIDQLAQMPENFNHGAAVAPRDGRVTKIEPAPQGGTNIFIDDEVAYTLPQLEPTVKVGDEVEAGDQLSTGILNPADVVRHKGLGEGRRYFATRFAQAFKDSGLKATRRNTEVLARAFLDNVEIDGQDGAGDFLPGDVVRYSALANSYVPRATAKPLPLKDAVGKYMEEPMLHHTIGTRITKKVAEQLSRYGYSQAIVDDNEPDFSPLPVRMQTAAETEPDWMAKLQGTYLKSNLTEDAQRGAQSDIHGYHPTPAVAYGIEFGKGPKSPATF